jgi:hypothetical protein
MVVVVVEVGKPLADAVCLAAIPVYMVQVLPALRRRAQMEEMVVSIVDYQ